MRDEKKKHGPQSVGSILDSVLDSTGLRRRSDERVILEDWEKLVGEKIARHSRPIDIRDGILYLEADHAAWRQELTLLMPVIMQKMNRKYGAGTIMEIKWKHGGNR